jgi:SAM-dependent methyltransferase
MLVNESIWIKDVLTSLSKDQIDPVANIGSSSHYFRTQVQPHIDHNVFHPLVLRSIRIYSLDVKSADGVDIVVDLEHGSIPESIKKRFRLVVCSNLLEHVIDRQAVLHNTEEILDAGGFALITVPYRYPKHLDPLDTMYRPTPLELYKSFPENKFVLRSQAVIRCGTLYRNIVGTPLGLVRRVARLFVPVPYRTWLGNVYTIPWMFRDVSVSCLLLQKNGA